MLKEDKIDLKYFKSEREESIFDSDEKFGLCFFCKTNTHPQIELDESIKVITKTKEEVEIVCLDCLFKGKYAFEHECLEEDDLLAMDKSKIKDLMQTPPFRAYQGANWLVHCNDFMTFVGTWRHEDFIKYSPNNNPKEFFDDILDNWNGDDFYDEQFGPNKSEYAESVFYAFQCKCCKKYRGYVE